MTKIIQTFWLPKTNNNPLLHSSSFVCPEIHYMSWAFSCLQLTKFYDEVELHTNQAGKKILIDQLGLPYTKVHLSLESEFMDELLPNMWAYCKIHTYSLQEESFLHVDGDVFIWEAFDEEMLQNPLIVQNIDENLSIYKQCLTSIQNKANFIPDWLTFDETQIRAFNAGIIGGNDILFFKEYTQLAFDFYDTNKSCLEELNNVTKHIHIVPEQFLPYVLAKKQNVKTVFQNTKIVTPDNGEFSHFFEIDKVPYENNYIHLLGNSKKSKVYNDFVIFVLEQEYPEYFHKIITVYTERNILSPYLKRQFQMQNNTQKNVLPQVLNPKEIFEYSNYFSKLYDIDFETDTKSVVQNLKLNDLYCLETSLSNFNKKTFDKIDIDTTPFPTYQKNSNVFENQGFEDYYIHITPYHELISTDFAWNEGLKATSKDEIEAMNPFRSYALIYLDVHYFSNNYIWLNEQLVHLIEKIKTTPTTIEELLNIKTIEPEADKNLLSLLKKWYAYGFIYLSKSKPSSQENSKIYSENQLNLKKQVSSCLNYIVDFYKTEGVNSQLILQYEEPLKIISLQEIIKTIQDLGFESLGVRGNIENLNTITTPAIALVKLRGFVNVHIVISKVTEHHVIIYNPEIMKEETYSKDYFSIVWGGVLILIIPKSLKK
jgi:hypothetical protein